MRIGFSLLKVSVTGYTLEHSRPFHDEICDLPCGICPLSYGLRIFIGKYFNALHNVSLNPTVLPVVENITRIPLKICLHDRHSPKSSSNDSQVPAGNVDKQRP